MKKGKFTTLLKITFMFLIFITFNCSAEIPAQPGFTPEILLQNAIKAGEIEDVKILIKDSIIVNQPSSQGITPLHTSVLNDQKDIVSLLIQAGALIDAKDQNTEATPLHLAVLHGRNAIANLLIQHGANINAEMKFGITPILVAAQFKQLPIVQLLIDNRADINHADEEGFTALHFAAQNGSLDIARMLIMRGAEINARDKANKATPLDIAIQNNHTEIAQLLQEYGAN